MIYFSFRLANPFVIRDDDYLHTISKHGRLTKNKFWEIEFHKSSDTIINFGIDLSFRRSHSGFNIWFGLLGYWGSFEIYDRRHWNSKNNCWETCEDE